MCIHRLLLSSSVVLLAAVAAVAGEDVAAVPPAEPRGSELEERLRKGLAARGPGYRPRTHHLTTAGAPRYTNRLILEASPYLLQHAHNPVDWYPWGDEAFAAAERLGRPVLLSIGYSTCHWCHVMEEESFEDEEIARYLNENYIAIKVDREERPDLDAIYMTAVQSLTGRGGWPMTTWLTPDRRPFYGGTYFPARDGDRGSRKGFLTLLRELRQAYDADPGKVADQAERVVNRIRSGMQQGAPRKVEPDQVIARAVEGFGRRFDAEYGGVGRAPKFPSGLPIRLLIRRALRSDDDHALDMATLTLDRMAAGGMHDQVGGGFHRYSTDRRWLVPHFEKMLYDNALLAEAYLDGYLATARPGYAGVVRSTLDYLSSEMTSPSGGLYSATDADSLTPSGESEEGWFFTWTPAEIDAALGEKTGSWFRYHYGVTSGGDYEGRTVLHAGRSVAETAAEFGVKPESVEAGLRQARRKLEALRSRRPAPLRDDKILTAWNGMAISAFARAGFVLDEPAYLARASAAADFLLENLLVDDRLHRSWLDGQVKHNAYLEDHAFLIAGLLDLYEATGVPNRLGQAIRLQKLQDRHYAAKNGGYYRTRDDHERLLVREKPVRDGAVPSGNSVALMNLARLHALTSDDSYRAAGSALVEAFGDVLSRSPMAATELLLALDFIDATPREVVIVVPRSREEARPFLDILRTQQFPYLVMTVVEEGEALVAHSRWTPLVKNKTARQGRATAYVCRGGTCRRPTTDAEDFASQLAAKAIDAP
jgi:uncharacterized protein YyaL (SSP411 family)